MDEQTDFDNFEPTFEQAKYFANLNIFERAVVFATLQMAGVDVELIKQKYAAKLAEAN